MNNYLPCTSSMLSSQIQPLLFKQLKQNLSDFLQPDLVDQTLETSNIDQSEIRIHNYQGFEIISHNDLPNTDEQEKSYLEDFIGSTNKPKKLSDYEKIIQDIQNFVQENQKILDRLDTQGQDLIRKIASFSKKSKKILKLKIQEEPCNFAAVNVYFQDLKKIFDPWFQELLEMFEQIEVLIQKFDQFITISKSRIEQTELLDKKLMVGICGSVALGILAAPITGYSIALGFVGSGSLGLKRNQNIHKINKLKQQISNIEQLKTHHVENIQNRLRNIIDWLLQNMKVPIESIINCYKRQENDSWCVEEMKEHVNRLIKSSNSEEVVEQLNHFYF